MYSLELTIKTKVKGLGSTSPLQKKSQVPQSQLICKSFFSPLLCFSVLILTIEWKRETDVCQHIIVQVTLNFKGELNPRPFSLSQQKLVTTSALS